MPITQNLFVKQILSSISSDASKPVKLSKDQRVVALAAYGIYAREIATKKEGLNKTIADLRVEVQEGRTELVTEQARTLAALLLNKESVKQFGRFLVEPIASWGENNKHAKLIGLEDRAAIGTDSEILVSAPEGDAKPLRTCLRSLYQSDFDTKEKR